MKNELKSFDIINQYGHFELVDIKNNMKIKLSNDVNFIVMKNNKIQIINPSISEYENSFIVRIADEYFEIIKVADYEINVNGQSINRNKYISEHDTIEIRNQILNISFSVKKNKESVEAILDMYLNQKPISGIDIEKVFLEYAKQKKITHKQASFIVASIDIPIMD